MVVQASPPMMYNGGVEWMEGGFLPSDLYQHCQQQQQQMMMGLLSSLPPPRVVGLPSYYPANGSVSIDQSLANMLEKQRNETDQYLRLMIEQFRLSLHQKIKQQMILLRQSLESKASFLLSQKEKELARARKRAMELEACVRRAEEEKETWQRIAMEKAAMAVSLNHTLEQIREPCLSSTGSPSPDAAVASCSGHPWTMEEPKTERGMGL